MLARLARRGCDPESALAAVGELERAGLMGDERYARERVRTELARRPAADALLEHTLTSRGVSPALAASTTRSVTAGQSESARANELVRTSVRAAALTGKPIAERRRLASLLARRGFDAEVAHSALETVLGPVPEVECDQHADQDMGHEPASSRSAGRSHTTVEET